MCIKTPGLLYNTLVINNCGYSGMEVQLKNYLGLITFMPDREVPQKNRFPCTFFLLFLDY